MIDINHTVICVQRQGSSIKVLLKDSAICLGYELFACLKHRFYGKILHAVLMLTVLQIAGYALHGFLPDNNTPFVLRPYVKGICWTKEGHYRYIK